MTQRYLSQTQPSRSFAAWIAGLALATAFLPFSSATAQEAADAAAEEAEDVLVLGVPAQQPAFSDDDIERWVFQNQQNAATARKEMAAMLKLKAEDIGRVCELTDAQQAKLQLAGRGDVNRFFDSFEAIREKFRKLKRDQENRNKVFQEISPLQMKLQAGLFHTDSFFHKSLRNTLTEEQFAGYTIVLEDRHKFRSRAQVELAVNTLEQGVPLSDAQRHKVIALLLAETKPSRKAGQYEYYVVMYQLSKVAEDKLKPILDDVQWKVVNQQLEQMRGMEQWLRQAGHLPDDDDAENEQEAPAEAVKQ